MWRTVKNFMNWKCNSGPPNQLEVHGKLVSNASELAVAMNNYFIQKVQKIRDSISRIPNDFQICKKIMDDKNGGLSMRFISLRKVNKLI